MAPPKLDTVTCEEFDRRLDASNERLRQELVAAQERVQPLETLIARKEAFNQRLEAMLAEIEQEEHEIAALEKGVRLSRTATRRSFISSSVPQ